MQAPEEPILNAVYQGTSSQNRAYALKRMKEVSRALEKVENWSFPGQAVRLGRIELSEFIRKDDGTATLVFRSRSNNSHHLTVKIMDFNPGEARDHKDAIAVMKEAQKALSAPIATNEQISFVGDITDLAAVLHSHVAMGCELTIGSKPHRHKLEIPMTRHLHNNNGREIRKEIEASNPKLTSLLDQFRDRIPLIAQCSISEKSGSFRIVVSPYTAYRHYPKSGLFQDPFHKPIDPMRAMGLVSYFKEELNASGYV